MTKKLNEVTKQISKKEMTKKREAFLKTIKTLSADDEVEIKLYSIEELGGINKAINKPKMPTGWGTCSHKLWYYLFGNETLSATLYMVYSEYDYPKDIYTKEFGNFSIALIKELKIINRTKKLRVKSLSRDIVFSKQHVTVDCQTITKSDVETIFKALGEWLGYEIES